MSDITHLPTRAEFIRDRLAHFLMMQGATIEAAEPESEFEHATLAWSGNRGASWWDGDCHIYFTTDRAFYVDVDVEFHYALLPDFDWQPEPTDTGVMHDRPRTRAQQRGHDAHDAINAFAHRVPGTTRTV